MGIQVFQEIETKLFERPKHGFLAPISKFMNDNKEFIQDTIKYNEVIDQKILNAEKVKNEINKFNKDNNFNQYNLWDIIIFQQWMRENKNNIV